MRRAVLVKSCRLFEDRRYACSHWAAELFDAGIPTYFVVGGQERNCIEAAILETNSGDAYADNSVKLRAAIDCLLKSIPGIEYLFIVDDDTFVHPRRWLLHEPAGEFECRLYRPKTYQERRLNRGRPWALGGGGWWMSRRVCELYAEHAAQRCSWDDVLATAIAQDHGVEIVDRPELYGGDGYTKERDRVAAHNRFITSHHITPDEMRRLYEATREL